MSGHFRFLFADDIHIHERNFKPLFRYVDKKSIPLETHREHDDLKRRQGDYDSDPALRPRVEALRALDRDSLFSYAHDHRLVPIRVFPLARAEALAFALATRDHWHASPVSAAEREVFDRLYERDRDILLWNMAAACFWIDAWTDTLSSFDVPPTHAFVFSGSLIYGRVLMELCKLQRTRCFVLEASFTGREFYLEERYTPIANRSSIRHRAVRDALRLPEAAIPRMRERAKALQRVHLAANKNVQQPDAADLPRWAEPDRPTCLVLGQVANDFSIIEQSSGYLSSIAFYGELVQGLLDQTPYNVIFKGHPWEHKKTHLRRPLTKEAMLTLRASLPDAQQQRFAVREHDNLVSIGNVVDRVVLLSSQGGIELAYYCGLKPSTLGHAFWGGAGFSDDYASLDELFADIATGRTRALLDLDEVEHLYDWLTRYLQLHLVTERTASISQVQRKLESAPQILLRTEPPSSAQSAIERPLSERTVRKLRKLQRDPRSFFRDAKWVRKLRER
ncbi:MAG: hypothetical protein RLO52_01835 [Sandaracinaceae bacterium]